MRQFFHNRPFFARLTFAFLLVLAATFAHSQVPVGMAPPLHFQFLTQSGEPLSSGKIFTYAAGTTTPLNTYVDATGTVQNTDPIILDATGSPANGTVETGIFLANFSYKFVAYNSANVLQWSVDNVSTYFGLLNSNNVWTGTNTFSLPVTITATDNQMVFGAPGNQTTLDLPPSTGNITLHTPNSSDTIVGRATIDTLTNKTLTNPVINGVNVLNSPGSYISIANYNVTGPAVNKLVSLTGAPSSATLAASAQISGVVGICISNCTTAGNAIVQQSGTVGCIFDGATTANDYVTASSSAQADCHDSGVTSTLTAPVGALGVVLSTNGGGGTYTIDLFSLGSTGGSGCTLLPSGCAFDIVATTGAASSNFIVPLAGGGMFRIGCYVIVTQPATTSSTMPSCVIGWTDADNSTVQSLTLTPTNAGNTTTTVQQATMVINAKASTNITWQTSGYVSSGATPMQYSVHLRGNVF